MLMLIYVTCNHARYDERKNDQLQHTHEDFPRETKVLFVEIGERSIFPDCDAKSDA